jgi:autotransporter-associated beta strand protein
MKPSIYRFTAAFLAVVALISSSALNAATYAWTGAVSGAWTPNTGNWSSNVTFGSAADLTFNTVTNGSMFLAFGRTVRSLSFGADIDSDVGVSFQVSTGGSTAYNLTFDTDAVGGNAAVTVAAGATGNITLGAVGSTGSFGNSTLSDNLVVDHNGSGLLLFNRPFQAGAFSITKNGTGTMQTNNNNLLTGALNLNAGTLVANTWDASGSDLNNFSAVNLAGGTLDIRPYTTGTQNQTKTYATVPVNVNAASTLVYKNSNPTISYNAVFSGPAGFVLNSDLTIKNTSSNATLSNFLTVSRNVTGTKNMTIETINDLANAELMNPGRLTLSGDNTGWSGDVIAKQGTVLFSGNTTKSSGSSGDIIIGGTANSYGAGVQYYAVASSTPTGAAQIINNDIVVRTGGFRALRTSSDHSYFFKGGLTLEGDLTVNNANWYNTYHILLDGKISGGGGLNITESSGSPGFVRLSGNNTGWSGNLTVAKGTLSLGGNAVNSAGTGAITLGTAASSNAAVLTISPQGTNGSTVSYANNITVNSGGVRTIKGGGVDNSARLTGNVTLNGDLTVDHTWGWTGRAIVLSGNVSGAGGLVITKSGGDAGTTTSLSGTNTYLGNTTVTTGASLGVTGSLTSNISVATGARFGGNGGSTTGTLSLATGAKFIFYVPTFASFNATGSVALGNDFGVASLVGGSQGEAITWASVPDGTYTLIRTTGSTFNNITNFGSANAYDLSGGRSAYFQNAGGLQLVVTTASAGYTAWASLNGASVNLSDDHDGDGVNNGTEYFLGGPTGNTTGNTALPSVTNTAGSLSITWLKGSGYLGTYATDFVVETSDTLSGAWVTETTGANVTDSATGVKYTFPLPLSGKKFARLKVTGP